MSEDRDSAQPNIDVIEILRRRGALLVWVAAIVMLIGVAYAYRSTPLYSSRGVLLAELPSIAESAARRVDSTPDGRVSFITQRVLSDDHVQAIITKDGLYREVKDSPGEARGRFKDPARLKLSAEDPQILESLLGTARPEGAMAFSVSFIDPSPRVARDVANDLVALYLEENREVRREQAAATIRFLTQEALRLEGEIAEREQKLAEFKTENAGALPDLADSNLQMLERAGRDVDAVEQEIRELRGQQDILSSELTLLSPSATVLNDQGAPVLGPYDRLKMLQREYLQLTSIYSADHPDVQKKRRELEAAGQSTGLPAFDRATLESELQTYEDQLSAAKDRFSPDHP